MHGRRERTQSRRVLCSQATVCCRNRTNVHITLLYTALHVVRDWPPLATATFYVSQHKKTTTLIIISTRNRTGYEPRFPQDVRNEEIEETLQYAW